MTARTLFEKIWNSHIVAEGSPALLYVDRHLVHEVTSPQAFDGLRESKRRVRRPDLTVATVDHNIPTTDRSLPILDQTSNAQIRALERNCRDFGIRLFGMDSDAQGIVHVIGPQLGVTLPGATIVCGDSHTSTHGAFGALALGIGTSEIEHVLASQTLWLEKPQPFEIKVSGKIRRPGVTAKDIILSIIREIGTSGGIGTVLEYRGDAISDLSMEERMTICNMSIEAGARAGLIAPDDKTYEYLRGRRYTPDNYEEMVECWQESLFTDEDAGFAASCMVDAGELKPQVSWGTNPAMTCGVDESVPSPEEYANGDPGAARGAERALWYMDLEPGTPITEISIDRVFIGSCTNARLADLIEASKVVRGKKVAESVSAMVVPGSQMVQAQAAEMGLDRIFKDAGFLWRNSGCSMCLGMNPDILKAGERCASTSNRNFEGRQGAGGRSNVVSPVMAAAAAIPGHFVDARGI